MLTLYQFDSCPFCWKVKALLNYAKQDYDIVEVSPFGMKELDFTDHKKVPVLRDGDKIITESATIVQYINDHYAHLPSNEGAEKWIDWIDDKLVHFLPPLIHPNFVTSFKNFSVIMRNSKSGFATKAIARLMGAIMMPKVAKKMKAKHNIQDPKSEFLAEIDHWVNNGLQGKNYFGGEQLDFVDCSVFGVLRSSHELGIIDMAKQHNAEFARWYDRCYAKICASAYD